MQNSLGAVVAQIAVVASTRQTSTHLLPYLSPAVPHPSSFCLPSNSKPSLLLNSFRERNFGRLPPSLRPSLSLSLAGFFYSSQTFRPRPPSARDVIEPRRRWKKGREKERERESEWLRYSDDCTYFLLPLLLLMNFLLSSHYALSLCPIYV